MPPNSPMKFLHNPDLGLLIMRLGVGAVGVFHGSQKLFGAFGGPGMKAFTGFLESMNVPAPQVSAYLAAVGEFGGGLLVALGLLPRVGAFLFAMTMLVAFAKAHHLSFMPDKPGGTGGDYAFFIMMICLGIIFTGAGRYSLMGAMSKPRHS